MNRVGRVVLVLGAMSALAVSGCKKEPTPAEIHKDKGNALAIGEFWTNGEQCGENALMSTVWDFGKYYTDQFKAIQDGKFVSKQIEFLDPETSFKLEDWGPNVSEDVKSQIEQTLSDSSF